MSARSDVLPVRRGGSGGGRLLAAVLAGLVPLAPGGAASARDFPPFGDSGTAQSRIACPRGQYLVGLSVRAGAWIDRLSIVCAAVGTDGATRPPFRDTATYGGGGGAAPVETTCAPGEIIVGTGLAMTRDNRQVRMFRFNCASLQHPTRHDLDVGALGGAPSVRQDCPNDEAVVGLTVNFGLHVNAAGLMCGAKPALAPPPMPKTGDLPIRLTGQPASPACTTDGPPLTADQQAICTEHNVERDKHHAPHVSWSTALAANAQAWAAGCHKDATGSFCHQRACGGGDPYGENLSWGWRESNGQPALPGRTGAEAVDGWYCEVGNYAFSDHPTIGTGASAGCGPANRVTGHFTQVVWKATARIGCAQQTCPVSTYDAGGHVTGQKPGTLWVCEYDPPGNNTDPGIIKQNVLPP